MPELSATLAATLTAGSVAVTTDKWLVGDRFSFLDLLVVDGTEATDEPINVFLWSVQGAPQKGGQAAALEDINARWMGEDACADDPDACAALMSALGFDLEEEL